MNKPTLLITTALLLSTTAVHADTQLATQIEQLMATHLSNSQVGLLIQDAATGQVHYQLNPTQRFTPASVAKLYTSAAGLLSLGQDFHYETAVYFNGEDVSIIFTGDPTLGTQDLDGFIAVLAEHNIDTIPGDIIIDNTYFDKPNYGRGWAVDSVNWYYSAPVQAVIIDENQVDVQLSISPNSEQVNFSFIDHTFDNTITADVVTATPKETETLCQLNLCVDNENNIEFYGCWPNNVANRTLKVAFKNPERQVAYLVEQALTDYNITLAGEITVGKAEHTDSDLLLTTYQSPQLNSLNQAILQASNNLYADSLAKVLGQKHYNRPTLQTGSYAIEQIIQDDLNIDISALKLYDGSGMSFHNQLTPANMADLLQAMFDHPTHQQAYMRAMLVDNDNHTLFARKPSAISQPLYLKSGAMTGVNNIAGYITTAQGDTLIVVSLLNQIPEDRSQARQFENALLTLLNNYSPDGTAG